MTALNVNLSAALQQTLADKGGLPGNVDTAEVSTRFRGRCVGSGGMPAADRHGVPARIVSVDGTSNGPTVRR
jgi:hypothetical protein